MRYSFNWTWFLLLLFVACSESDAGPRNEAELLAVSQQALSSDSDGDGVADSVDNCPQLANANQANSNGIGPGDACELSFVLSGGLLNQYARFQSHKELLLDFSPLMFSVGPDLIRVDATAPALAFANISMLSLKLGVQSLAELLPGSVDTIGGSEVLTLRLGSSSVLGGAKASEVYLRLDGTANVSVSFFEGSTARGTQSLSQTGTALRRFAPSAGARFDRIELRATSGKVSLRGPNEVILFTLGQAQLPCPSGYERVGSECVDINECAGIAQMCDPLTTCNNTAGSYTCTACPGGYRGTGRTSCVDIDECVEQPGLCSSLVQCHNTAGSYECPPCPAGYRGDGRTCTDIDECAENLDTCDAHATCVNQAGSYECGACLPGYAGGGSGGCSDINECEQPNPVCFAPQSCTNTDGSYQCSPCPTGYRGDGKTCLDINECLEGSADCSPLVACQNTDGSYHCTPCPTGFRGDGRTCADVDECAEHLAQCTTGFSCRNTVGSYECGACPEGYTGDGYTCQDINECERHPCDDRTVCTNKIGSFECSACPSGFRGTGYAGCVDVNECAEDLDTCSDLVTCANTLGSYTCDGCPSGYAGDGHTCTDVDECALHTAQCFTGVACHNNVGSYSCGPCPTGYNGDGHTCTDIDECLTTPCDSLTQCHNNEGSYTCTSCPAGYQGNGYAGCLDIDECAVNNGGCADSEACENSAGSYRCRGCPSGTVGVVTQCGRGACASQGVTSCVHGIVSDSCVPGAPAGNDAVCNGVDDDCDGPVDEDFEGQQVSCGVGRCFRTRATACIAGAVDSSCVPGTPASSDLNCDGVDDDCNGAVDDGTESISCGLGACERPGSRACINGVVTTSCVPGTPEASDAICDARDEDCDGTADEDYPVTTCGGGCVAGGTVSCVGGVIVNGCASGNGTTVDTTCDGVDDDCDGQLDEDFVQTATTCGTGVCGANGVRSCVNGAVVDSCAVPVGKSCNDGELCNGADACNAAGACAPVSDRALCCSGVLAGDPLAETPLDPSVIATFAEAAAPLYLGAGASQRPVTPGAIDVEKVAVVRGFVLSTNGQPVSCAAVSILGKPEVGVTRTAADGSYALAVNGGDTVTIHVQQQGYIPSNRSLPTVWLRDAFAPEIRLLPYAPAQAVSALATTTTVVAGGLESDEDGSRRLVMFFPPGTQATVQGEGTPRTQYGVRLKEMTNRSESGREGMPATLPPQSAFTYAFSASIEGAETADVTFNKPIPTYVDNFLGFPNGEIVPVGRWDEAKRQWIAQENGRVIRIVGVDSQGRAQLDIDAVPGADDASVLGIDAGELVSLANRYQQGQSLWRVTMRHFSDYDLNWGWSLDFDERGGPSVSQATPSLPPNGACTNQANGSIIECEAQVLREEVAIPGTSFQLVYSSGRQIGGPAYHLRIPLTDERVSEKLSGVRLEVMVAGRIFSSSYSVGPNLVHNFYWDGLDSAKRMMRGPQQARVRVGYNYRGTYRKVSTFAEYAALEITASRTRMDGTVWQSYMATIGNVDAHWPGLGGWTLNVHHQLDPRQNTVYFGNGTQKALVKDYSEVFNVAGNGTRGYGADGVQALESALTPSFVPQVAEGPDGSLYIGEDVRIRKVAPDGTITVIAGGGSIEFLDDIDAKTARLVGVNGPVLGPDGHLYFVEVSRAGVSFVRKVDLGNGKLYTVYQYSNASLQGGIAVGSDGSLYVTGQNGDVRHIRDGKSSVIGAGFGAPMQLAVMADGTVLVADRGFGRIAAIGPDGIARVIAGGGTKPVGDGVLATDVNLFGTTTAPLGVSVSADQIVHFSLGGAGATNAVDTIYKLNVDGTLTRIMGGFGSTPSGTPSGRARVGEPRSLNVARNGDLFVFDYFNSRILRMRVPKLASGAQRVIPSEDGSQLYHFDARGKHQRTIDANTGAALFEFSYDAAGLLARVRDEAGNETVIERSTDGGATAIVAPHGQRTALTIDETESLRRVTRPDGSAYTFEYQPGGLLSAMRDPNATARNGAPYNFNYIEGRLIADQDPTRVAQTLTRTEIDKGWSVKRTTPLGRATTHVLKEVTPSIQQSTTFPDGSTSTSERRVDFSTQIVGPADKQYDQKTVAADQTTTYTLTKSHSAYGSSGAYPAERVTVLPSGLTRVETNTESTQIVPGTGQVVSASATSGVNGRNITLTYDGASRTVTTISPAGRLARSVLDEKGRTVRVEAVGTLPLTMTYDSAGRLARTTQGARESVFTYTAAGDSKGYLETVTDALNHATRFERDALGQVLRQTLPDNEQLSFSWDGVGAMTSVTPPEKPTHTQAFTAIGLQSKYIAPTVLGVDSSATTYTPDADRNLKSIAWPDGRTTAVTYTAAGKLDVVTIAEGTYDHDYYGATPCTGCTPGKLSRVTSPSGVTLNFSYDGALPTAATWTGTVSGSVAYQYDADFRPSRETVTAGSATSAQFYGYDADSLLTCVSTSSCAPQSADALSLTYDPQVARLTQAKQGQTTETHTYSEYGELATLTGTHGTTQMYAEVMDSVASPRDKLGRVLTRVDSLPSGTKRWEYHYDAQGRLDDVLLDGAPYEHLTYDGNGNRLTRESASGVESAEYDLQDRLLRSGVWSYTYNANGQLRTKTNTQTNEVTTYSYDVRGNLLKVELPAGDVIEYVVDGVNRRVGKRKNGVLVKRWLYRDGLRPVAELDGAGALLSRFVYGSRANVPDLIVRGGVTYRVFADHLGSPRVIVATGSTPTVVQVMEHDAFGRVLGDTNSGWQPFGFAGGLWDAETGLVRFGARDYDPVTGRWTAKDPIRFAGGQSNLYAYVNNDPANYTDPSGLILPVIGAAVCAFGGCEALGAAAGYTAALLASGLAGGLVATYENDIATAWHDLLSWSKSRDQREGDGTRGKSYDEIRELFKDKLTAGELAKFIQQIEKIRGERNRQKRKNRGGGFPGLPCGDDDDDDE